jgi:hypothetical protein
MLSLRLPVEGQSFDDLATFIEPILIINIRKTTFINRFFQQCMSLQRGEGETG